MRTAVAAVHWAAVRRSFVQQVAAAAEMTTCVVQDLEQALRKLERLVTRRRAYEPALLLTWPPAPEAHEKLTALRGDHGLACERYVALHQLQELLATGQLDRERLGALVAEDNLWLPRPPGATTLHSLTSMTMPVLAELPPVDSCTLADLDWEHIDWDNLDWESLRL